MEENKPNHLRLEAKHFIVQKKVRKPRKTISDLIFEVSTKYGVKTLTGTLHRVLKAKEKILENFVHETKLRLKQKSNVVSSNRWWYLRN